MVVYGIDIFKAKRQERSMAEDEYADALLQYWTAVKAAEEKIAPYFSEGTSLTPEQREVIAGVVAQVGAAEEAYFVALESAGHASPRPLKRAEGS
jgi:hypothetical protein